ncbi:flagellar biosynthesis protein FlhB [Thermospira aquatica]|uniref:Flagellar biosynthetic protein FlhB n=1 Tax=Thermospira aquatica TaxID=2828656 RepID=A0AAX3BA43_9SPIR|nr:flagellar biosynthesis protein FlhB [Thermospira aquatica]URA09094.1 flagellar biosynthesis protein FlhB [Thermospira aquatica]
MSTRSWLLSLYPELVSIEIDLQLFAAEDEGRTEEPTEYKKRKAREEGQIPRSQELTAIIVFLIVFWAVSLIAAYLWRLFFSLFRFYLENILNFSFSSGNFSALYINMLWIVAQILLPIFLVAVVAAIISNALQGGFVFTTKRIQFNLAKIWGNIGKNFVRMFWSVETLFNMAKSLLKLVGVFSVAILFMLNRFGQLITLARMTVLESVEFLAVFIFQFVSTVGILLLVFAVVDYAFQRWNFIQSLKMTKQEIKEEFKEMEGNPEIKAKIREMQRRFLSQNLAREVPKADVVITNPTHIAVALKYDPHYMNAPVVIAKGEGPIAERIKALAKENDIYVIENKPLARSLYQLVDVGEEIPPEFFEAVARILSIVYQARGKSVVA